MIDARFQGRGYGRAALNRLLSDLWATHGAIDFYTMAAPANAAAIAPYEAFGFRRTGGLLDPGTEDEETILRRTL